MLADDDVADVKEINQKYGANNNEWLEGTTYTQPVLMD